MACNCCVALNRVCQYAPDNNYAAAILCNGVVSWVDVETGTVVDSNDVNCAVVPVVPPAIPDFVPGNVIDIQFNDDDGSEPVTQEQRAFFVAARDDYEACIATNPPVFQGSNKITLAFQMDDTIGANVIANAGPRILRPNNMTFTANMNFNPNFYAGSPSNRQTFFHEMTHAMGMSTGGPLWAPRLIADGTPNAGFTGPQAVAAYNAMPGRPGPPVDRVPKSFNPNTAHWNERNDHVLPGDCFENELMGPVATGTQAMSPVTAAMLRDFGYDFDGGCVIVDQAYVCNQP